MNVTGQEVATGLADPLNMFAAVIGISVLAAFIWILWQAIK